MGAGAPARWSGVGSCRGLVAAVAPTVALVAWPPLAVSAGLPPAAAGAGRVFNRARHCPPRGPSSQSQPAPFLYISPPRSPSTDAMFDDARVVSVALLLCLVWAVQKFVDFRRAVASVK